MNLKLSSIQMDIIVFVSVLFLVFLPNIFSQLSEQPISSIGIFIYIGCLMFFAEKFKTISHISRIFNWLSMNFWKPKTRYNNIIVGIFLWLMAFIIFANFKTTANQEAIEYEKYFETSWEYWASLISLIVASFIIGRFLHNKQKI